jgi:hypothetical protein
MSDKVELAKLAKILITLLIHTWIKLSNNLTIKIMRVEAIKICKNS